MPGRASLSHNAPKQVTGEMLDDVASSDAGSPSPRSPDPKAGPGAAAASKGPLGPDGKPIDWKEHANKGIKEEERLTRSERDSLFSNKKIMRGLKKAKGGMATKIERQQLRTIKIKEGVQTGVPRCSIKLLLVAEGLGHFTDYFLRARYDIVDLYTKKTNAEVDYILNSVQKANKMVFSIEDRVRLFKLFRYRHFNAPEHFKSHAIPTITLPEEVDSETGSKVSASAYERSKAKKSEADEKFANLREIPLLYMSKHSSKMADDSDMAIFEMDSDRQRQVTRKARYDEKEGMKFVQLERYDRECDIVHEIRDVMQCCLEWEHIDPKTVLKIDPRERALVARLDSLERRIAFRKLTNAMEFRRKRRMFGRLSNGKFLLLGLCVLILAIGFFGYADAGSLGFFVILELLFSEGYRFILVGTSFFTAFCTAFRIGAYEKVNVELLRLKKMETTIKRFRHRVQKFQRKTEPERLERFDTVMADLSSYFESRSKEKEEEAQRKRDEALLSRFRTTGITFDEWMDEKTKLLKLGGEEQMYVFRMVANLNKYSRETFHTLPHTTVCDLKFKITTTGGAPWTARSWSRERCCRIQRTRGRSRAGAARLRC